MKIVGRSQGINLPKEKPVIGLVGQCPVLARKNGEISLLFENDQL